MRARVKPSLCVSIGHRDAAATDRARVGKDLGWKDSDWEGGAGVLAGDVQSRDRGDPRLSGAKERR